jgi:hypothetical protein
MDNELILGGQHTLEIPQRDVNTTESAHEYSTTTIKA